MTQLTDEQLNALCALVYAATGLHIVTAPDPDDDGTQRWYARINYGRIFGESQYDEVRAGTQRDALAWLFVAASVSPYAKVSAREAFDNLCKILPAKRQS